MQATSRLRPATGGRLKQNYDILTPEECDLTIDIAPDGKLSGTITNNTEDRWRKAEVFLRAEDGNGGPGGALLKMGSDELWTSFSYADVYAEYVKPGATVDLVSEVGARRGAASRGDIRPRGEGRLAATPQHDVVAANDDAAVRGGMPRIRSPRPLPAEGRGAGPTLYASAPFLSTRAERSKS